VAPTEPDASISMRWRRSSALRQGSALWLAAGAAALGFWLGYQRPGDTSAPAVGTPKPAMRKRAHHRRVVGVACAALLLGGGALGALAGLQSRQDTALATALTGGDPAHGPALMIRFGCGGCHTIPGVPGADGQVGPSLFGLRKRVFVGNGVRNTAANLMAWIVDDPRVLSSRSAMPVTGISPDQARDVAAYLYAH
jgi:mono/diheme cytochrome c family protein